jgi:hypothetical protein
MPKRFELRQPGQKYSDADLLDDIRRVANLLGVSRLGQKHYSEHGRYDMTNLTRRFGGWNAALDKAGLKSLQTDPLSEEELLSDLRMVAKKLGKESLGLLDYRRHGTYSEAPFLDRFGTWTAAVSRAGLSLAAGYHPPISDEEYFRDLEDVWIKLGRQPTYGEMQKNSRHAITGYARRFGSWRKALESFVDYMNRAEPVIEPVQPQPEEERKPESGMIKARRKKTPPRTSRAPSDRLRFLVMRRDNFSCRSCGRSPAVEQGVILHIDHLKAWAEGGETVLENLQTLCERCNLGKGKLNFNES